MQAEVTEAADGSVLTSITCPDEGCAAGESCENTSKLENGVLTNTCGCAAEPIDTAEVEPGVVHGCGVPVDLTAVCHELSP